MNKKPHPYYDVLLPLGWYHVTGPEPARMGDKHLVEGKKPWPLVFDFVPAQRCGEPALGFRCLIRKSKND